MIPSRAGLKRSCAPSRTSISHRSSISRSTGATPQAPRNCSSRRGRSPVPQLRARGGSPRHDSAGRVRPFRALGALTQHTGVSRAEGRVLFTEEFARLARGATVRSCLIMRAASNVLARCAGSEVDGGEESPDSRAGALSRDERVSLGRCARLSVRRALLGRLRPGAGHARLERALRRILDG